MILTYKKKTAKKIGLENSDKTDDERNAIVNEIMSELKSMVQGYEELEDDSKREYYFMGKNSEDIPVFLSKHTPFLQKLVSVVGYQKEIDFEEINQEDGERNWFFRAVNYILSMASPEVTSYDPRTKITKESLCQYFPTLESYKEQAWEEIRDFEKQLKVSLGLIPIQDDWFFPHEAPGKTKYIQEMIDAGILYSDGERVMKKLGNVISFLEQDKKIEVTSKYLSETFKKSNGEPYSERTARRELEAAHTK